MADTKVTLTKIAPRLFCETSYKVNVNGEHVAYVSKKRREYDANKYKGGRRGNARMVTATVWVYENKNPRNPSANITFDSRTRALAWFLEYETGLSGADARAAVTAARVTKED